jgi:hypothetical protein
MENLSRRSTTGLVGAGALLVELEALVVVVVLDDGCGEAA